MAAINTLAVRDAALHQFAKRGNWASREPGVIVVFCIVFIVAVGLIGLFVHKKIAARKASKSAV